MHVREMPARPAVVRQGPGGPRIGAEFQPLPPKPDQAGLADHASQAQPSRHMRLGAQPSRNEMQSNRLKNCTKACASSTGSGLGSLVRQRRRLGLRGRRPEECLCGRQSAAAECHFHCRPHVGPPRRRAAASKPRSRTGSSPPPARSRCACRGGHRTGSAPWSRLRTEGRGVMLEAGSAHALQLLQPPWGWAAGPRRPTPAAHAPLRCAAWPGRRTPTHSRIARRGSAAQHCPECSAPARHPRKKHGRRWLSTQAAAPGPAGASAGHPGRDWRGRRAGNSRPGRPPPPPLPHLRPRSRNGLVIPQPVLVRDLAIGQVHLPHIPLEADLVRPPAVRFHDALVLCSRRRRGPGAVIAGKHSRGSPGPLTARRRARSTAPARLRPDRPARTPPPSETRTQRLEHGREFLVGLP